MILILARDPARPNRVVQTVIQQIEMAGEDYFLTAERDLSLKFANSGRTETHHLGQGSIEPEVIFYWLPNRGSILDALELSGHRLINPAGAWRIGRDKALQVALFEKNGIRHPWTFFTTAGWQAVKTHVGWDGREIVLKPHNAGRGRAVVKTADRRVAARALSSTPRYRTGVLVQEYVDHSPKPRHHWRVNVIGGEPVTAVRLDVTEGWITNQARGGQVYRPESRSEVPAEAVELALAAVAAVGADYSGVDVIEGGDGLFYVLETNELPGFAETSAEFLGKFIVDTARAQR